MKNQNCTIKNALISTFNKNGIAQFAKHLLQKNIQIYSTNNTQIFLKQQNIITKNIYDITQFPEILNGKIKTLHPKIFGGILGTQKYDTKDIEKYNITIFDLLIVNFYPLSNYSNNIDIIKYIDIGGPAMVRAGVKNYKNTAVIIDKSDYKNVLEEIDNYGYVSYITKLNLAKKAFEYLVNYDNTILQCLQQSDPKKDQQEKLFPKNLYFKYVKKQNLKYGENPYQKSALYIKDKASFHSGCIDTMKQLNGNQLSYNNIYDAHIAFECINQFTQPGCVIVKHGNPCGAALSTNVLLAYFKAYNSDQISAFGGIIAFNQLINEEIVISIIKNQFVEVIIAPNITDQALQYIKNYPKIKLIICGTNNNSNTHSEFEFKSIKNSLLIQNTECGNSSTEKWKIVTKTKISTLELKYAEFCWKITKFVKSNAIVCSHKFNIISISSGQTNRLEAVKHANTKLKNNEKIFNLHNKKIIMSSDAFFPFRDSIDICQKNHHKISCIIQPGGSIRDSEVIQAANEHNICMIFTQERIFKH